MGIFILALMIFSRRGSPQCLPQCYCSAAFYYYAGARHQPEVCGPDAHHGAVSLLHHEPPLSHWDGK
jgi:hypothetical protein